MLSGCQAVPSLLVKRESRSSRPRAPSGPDSVRGCPLRQNSGHFIVPGWFAGRPDVLCARRERRQGSSSS
eukprot:scaffold14854_cov129-Isochrysis_galbana.AAC.5